MDKQEKNIEEAQVMTERMDIGTKEFAEFQAILLNKANERSEQQKKNIELTALRFKMEDYLRKEDSHSKLVGDFLKDHLSVLKIKQNKFADYIGIRSSNLSKLINGERSLNHELALVFGKLFNNDPMLWLDIQDKNKLNELAEAKKEKIESYSLDDLISH